MKSVYLCLICVYLVVIAFAKKAENVSASKTSTAKDEKYNILAFLPMPGKSHHRVWQPLLRELAHRGHHVTYFTTYTMPDPPANFTEVYLSDPDKFMEAIMKRADIDESGFMGSRGLSKHYMLMDLMRKWGIALAKESLEHKDVQNLIQSDLKFDAVILESSFVQEPFIALQHKFNAVTIEIQCGGNFQWGYWIHGNPLDTNYIVDSSVPYTDKMTLLERIQNTVNSLITRAQWLFLYVSEYQELMDSLVRYPGWKRRPSMMDMVRRTSLVLVNTHYSLNYPYPMAPNFKEVGGINLVPPKPLPKDLQEFMDGAKDGVIYFTLGSYLQVSTTLGEKLRPIFIDVFSKLKQRVLMKWEVDFPDLPSNIKISKWFPQQDILAHKNLKLFITHGGFLSLTEAVNQGVPLLGIPMLGDQVKNIKHAVHHEYGLKIEYENITEQLLRESIDELLTNRKFAANIKKRSEMFNDKPQTALETAVYWTEYVIRHKGAHHLQPAIATMPWYQQAMIDVYGIMAAAVLIPLYILYKFVMLICRCCCRFSSNKSKKKRD